MKFEKRITRPGYSPIKMVFLPRTNRSQAEIREKQAYKAMWGQISEKRLANAFASNKNQLSTVVIANSIVQSNNSIKQKNVTADLKKIKTPTFLVHPFITVNQKIDLETKHQLSNLDSNLNKCIIYGTQTIVFRKASKNKQPSVVSYLRK